MEQLENEIWKPTFVNPYYLVSNKGRIKTLDRPIWCKVNQSYSIRKGKILTANNHNTKRYWRIGIPSETGNKASKKLYPIHRLVATAFLPNPNNLPQINHIDGNKDNNCVENLEWCDNTYNQRHAIEHGLKDRSKMSAHSSFRKLSEEQVQFIKVMYNHIDESKYGEKTRFYKTIKELFNLQSESTVYWITSGGTNKFFNQDIVQTTNHNEWLSEYNRLWEVFKPKKTHADYAKELGVIYSSFNGRFRMFNKDLDATIDYYKNLHDVQ
jgi:hypothetical protein